MPSLWENKFVALLVFVFVVGVGIAGIGVVVAANNSIDDFNNGNQQVCLGGAASFCATYNITSANSTDVSGILGGERDIRLTNYNGPSANQVNLRAGTSGNPVLEFSQDSNASATAEVVWDGQDNDPHNVNTSLLSVDLTNGGTDNAFRFVTTFNDLSIGVEIVIYCSSSDTSSATLSLPGGINTATEFVVPFSNFSTKSGSGCPPQNTGTTPAKAVQLLIDGSVSPGADLNIDWFGTTTTNRDYGDLPAGYNLSTQGDNGARHVVDSLKLGSQVDNENDGFETADANGDDNDNLDDEDGVVRTPGVQWHQGGSGSVDVTVNGCGSTCYFNGWIDWNGDNDFADPDEQIFNDKPLGDGTHSLPVPIPNTVDPHGNTFFARFRICRAQNECNQPTGEAASGEVEDYKWGFSPTAVTLEVFTGTAVTSKNPAFLLGGLVVGLSLLALGWSAVMRRKR